MKHIRLSAWLMASNPKSVVSFDVVKNKINNTERTIEFHRIGGPGTQGLSRRMKSDITVAMGLERR